MIADFEQNLSFFVRCIKRISSGENKVNLMGEIRPWSQEGSHQDNFFNKKFISHRVVLTMSKQGIFQDYETGKRLLRLISPVGSHRNDHDKIGSFWPCPCKEPLRFQDQLTENTTICHVGYPDRFLTRISAELPKKKGLFFFGWSLLCS